MLDRAMEHTKPVGLKSRIVQGFGDEPPKPNKEEGLNTMSTATGSTMMKTREIKEDDDFFKDFPKPSREKRAKPAPIQVSKNNSKETNADDFFSLSSNKKKGRFMDRFK